MPEDFVLSEHKITQINEFGSEQIFKTETGQIFSNRT